MCAKTGVNSEFEDQFWHAAINFQGTIGCGRVQACCARPYFLITFYNEQNSQTYIHNESIKTP